MQASQQQPGEALAPMEPTAPRPSKWRPLLVVIALLVLNTLFVLPAALRDMPDQPWRLFMPSGELLVLLTVYVLSARLRFGALLRIVTSAAAVLLWFYMWDELVGNFLLHQTPLLYDQLFLLRHLGVLIGDLWSWPMFGGLLGVLVGLTLLLWGARVLLAIVSRDLHARTPLQLLLIAAGAWGLVAALSIVHTNARPPRPLAHWVTPALAKNLAASRQMYEEMERGLGESPYVGYDSEIVLTRKPDVQLFLVESYGRLLWSHPETTQSWPKYLRSLESGFQRDGWHMASGFVKAPVSGGRSWLAEASILTGISVRYEAVFRHLLGDIEKIPNLVGFLKKQGYQTILLAPKDRARPGVELENRYGYHQMICHDDLDYRGHRVGWGEIPDQFSLGFAHETAFTKTDAPIFTNFHMVSSHAPWKAIPRLVEDWRTLNESVESDGEVAADESEVEAEETQDGEKDLGEFVLRMRRYQRQEPKFLYMGESSAMKIGSYVRSIRYDMNVLFDYLEGLQGDKLIIIMGDHQPPLIAQEDNSYDVPMHVFSRDPKLLETFIENGFTQGLALDGSMPTLIAHEGLFSLFVRNLANCCAEPGRQLPEVIFDGVRIGSPTKW